MVFTQKQLQSVALIRSLSDNRRLQYRLFDDKSFKALLGRNISLRNFSSYRVHQTRNFINSWTSINKLFLHGNESIQRGDKSDSISSKTSWIYVDLESSRIEFPSPFDSMGMRAQKGVLNKHIFRLRFSIELPSIHNHNKKISRISLPQPTGFAGFVIYYLDTFYYFSPFSSKKGEEAA